MGVTTEQPGRSIDLKPCPFCGCTSAEVAEWAKSLGENPESQRWAWKRYCPQIVPEPFANTWVVTCNNCGITVAGGWHNPEDAAEGWNTRAEPKGGA